MKKLVILGAGTAGTMVANRLARLLDMDQWEMTLVDQGPIHYYQPGFLFLPFGLYTGKDVVKPKSQLIPAKAHLIQATIEAVDAAAEAGSFGQRPNPDL